jgi:aerobic-type carbon monoxide dehydrogenase small subunit (CoxS/CutS family)
LRPDEGDAILKELTLRVNGQNHKVAVDDPDTPLLCALRDDLRLRGPSSAAALASAAPAPS